MSEKYKIRDQDKLYFVTFTVVEWVDVFTPFSTVESSDIVRCRLCDKRGEEGFIIQGTGDHVTPTNKDVPNERDN